MNVVLDYRSMMNQQIDWNENLYLNFPSSQEIFMKNLISMCECTCFILSSSAANQGGKFWWLRLFFHPSANSRGMNLEKCVPLPFMSRHEWLQRVYQTIFWFSTSTLPIFILAYEWSLRPRNNLNGEVDVWIEEFVEILPTVFFSPPQILNTYSSKKLFCYWNLTIES